MNEEIAPTKRSDPLIIRIFSILFVSPFIVPLIVLSLLMWAYIVPNFGPILWLLLLCINIRYFFQKGKALDWKQAVLSFSMWLSMVYLPGLFISGPIAGCLSKVFEKITFPFPFYIACLLLSALIAISAFQMLKRNNAPLNLAWIICAVNLFLMSIALIMGAILKFRN